MPRDQHVTRATDIILSSLFYNLDDEFICSSEVCGKNYY